MIRDRAAFDDFSLWLNDEPGIQPSDGFNVTDLDRVQSERIKFWHRFRFGRSREVQCCFFLEYKTNWKDVNRNQKDSLHMIHQLCTTTLFNFQDPKTGRIRKGHKQNAVSRTAWSYYTGKPVEIELKCFGVFLLRMSGTTPDNSDKMEWSFFREGDFKDRRIMSPEMLKDVLSFKRHPISWRKDNLARPHKGGDDRPQFQFEAAS